MRTYKTAQGRSSLYLAIKALAIKDKKYIITQAFTCSAVPEAIIFSGFTPFWLDIELDTFSIDIEKFIAVIEKFPSQFAAIFIQHTFGLVPKNYEELKILSKKNNIPIIEDRCHCNYIKNYKYLIRNKSREKIAYCYSFENAKPINLGRGGVLLVSNLSVGEFKKIDKEFKTFKNQNFFKSILHLNIAFLYNFFYKSIFYFPMLSLYRKLANKGIMPSNFNNFLYDFSCENIGYLQDKIISFLTFACRISLDYNSNIIIKNIFINFLNNYFSREERLPLYVQNKEKAISICKKNFIPVKDFFNTPIQPLKPNEYKNVNYTNNLCRNAEKASRHIISFDKIPSKKLLMKIKN